MSKRCASVYALTAIPPFFLFCFEEGAKLGMKQQNASPKALVTSFGFAVFKGAFYPYYFYKYSKASVSFE
nr:transmembrane domain containing protein [Marseillevirus futianmevirus]